VSKQNGTYNARLIKGGALVAEVRQLLRVWHPAEDAGKLAEDLVRDNALGKTSRIRTKDVLRVVFVPRYVEGNPPNAWRFLQPLERANWPIESLRPLLYYHAARSDALLYDFVTQVVYGRWRSGSLDIAAPDAVSFIRQAQKQGKVSPPWSDAVILRVAQGLLSALRDFGVLTGKVLKRIAPPHLPIPCFVYIAFLIKQETPSGQRVLEHPDWRLFLLDNAAVERLFMEAHQQGYLQYHALGNIIRIEFEQTTMEGLLNVLLARSA